MADLNRTTLFAYLRKAPFGGRLTQQQVDGVEQILAGWQRNASEIADIRWLAYIMATAFHETGGRMVAVREGFAKSDAAARKVVAKRDYGRVDRKTGHVYYGRGHVQLTWAHNYRRLGEELSIRLYQSPDLALDPEVSADILVLGMLRGLYTGKKLADYFNGSAEDPKGARKIVNVADKADLIAGYYKQFLGALQAAEESTPQPTDVKAKDAAPDAPSLARDKTVIGTIMTTIGAGGAGALTAVDNVWALLALVLVGIGVILFLTGRLKIVREAGA